MFHMAVNAHFYALIIPYFTLYIMVRIGSVMKRNAAMRGQRLRGSESYYRDVLCCSPTAVGVRQQSAAWGGGELRGSEEPQILYIKISTFCHPKGGAKMCRGETISGSALRLR